MAIESNSGIAVSERRQISPDKAASDISSAGKLLLLDGYSTRTLACVRSWGRKNVAFAVGGETGWDMSLFSRYSREKFVYTSPRKDVAGFIRDINRFCRDFRADRVFPTSEAAIMACNQYRAELECPPVIPRDCDIQLMFSKANTLKIAASLGIRAPWTLHITRDNEQVLRRTLVKFPVVVKSESSEVLLSTRASTSRKTVYLFSREALEVECRSRLAMGQSVLVQEFIDGYGIGVSGLYNQGRPVALMAHRRIRESDPLGGPSALAETIPLSPKLLRDTTALITEIGFSGPAMVEYKVDRRSGQPYLMEINGRFWGTVLLGPAAGLDLPYLYWKMLNGMEVRPEETHYHCGIRGRYLVGDTKYLLLALKGKPEKWPGTFASRWAAVKAYAGSFFDRQTKDLLLTRDDPGPFFARLVQDFA
jgi:predicted ATP-grasp superfamily ATP-dependent carboligase